MIPRWLLKSIFALFPEQPLKGLASEKVISSIPWQIVLGKCFRGFVLPVLEYCSAVWYSPADTHLKLLDRVVTGASFLTGGVFKRDLAHRRSVAVLFMLYKIRCNPMRPLYDALPEPYVPVRVTCGAVSGLRTLVRLLDAEPRSTTGLLFTCQYFSGTILVTPYSMVWDWRISRAGPIPFYWPSFKIPFCLLLFSLSLLSFNGLYCGSGVLGLIGC